MKSADIIHIWKKGHENEPGVPKYSLADIQAYRKKKSKQTSRSGRLTILFDIGYKAVIVSALVFLLTLVKQPSYQIATGSILILALILIGIEAVFVKKLRRIKETDSVIGNLKNQLVFLKDTYTRFLFIGALSNPLFVATGFLFYHFFKYGETQLESLLKDPVLYLFLIVAYGISMVGQWPFHKKQIREVGESIQSVDDHHMASMQLEEARKTRTKYIIMFSIFILIGVLVMLLLLYQKGVI